MSAREGGASAARQPHRSHTTPVHLSHLPSASLLDGAYLISSRLTVRRVCARGCRSAHGCHGCSRRDLAHRGGGADELQRLGRDAAPGEARAQMRRHEHWARG